MKTSFEICLRLIKIYDTLTIVVRVLQESSRNPMIFQRHETFINRFLLLVNIANITVSFEHSKRDRTDDLS